jgi:hypothetical protein
MTDLVILTIGSNLTAAFSLSLVETIKELTNQKINFHFGIAEGALVADSRDLAFREAQKKQFLKLIWIDSDIAWTPQDFFRLISSEQDIMSGVYVDELSRVVAAHSDNQRVSKKDIETANAPFEVGWAGMGFMAISKDVANDLVSPFHMPNCGEDVSFCYSARECGYSTFIDPSIQVIHYKSIGLKL